MLDYVSQVSEERRELINPDLFERTFDLPLSEQIIAIVKNLSVIPGLKLKGWEIIPFGENARVNKNHTKDKKIKNNPQLEKLNPIRDSWVDLIRFEFEINIGGDKTYVTKEMYCFRANKHHYYMIGGRKVIPLNQIVDNSTYVKGTVLNFKTSTFSYPIMIDTDVKHVITTDGTIIKGRKYTISIFAKESNFLLYYLAKMGMENVIEYFKMDGIIAVVPEEINPEENYYYKVSSDIYVEMNKKFYRKSPFISDFYLSLIDVIKPIVKPKKNKKESEDTFEYIFADMYKKQYWMETFAEMYNKRSAKVAKNGLISFERLIDNLSIRKLTSLKIEHRKSIYTVVRYLVTNYDELLKKDNFNLENRRIRNNEVIASYFDGYLRNNINSLLNSSEITIERINRLLNTIGHYSLFKAIRGKNPYDLFRYERYNDNTSIELSRYTMKGAGAISGGKHNTPLQYRASYPSYLGRIDLNVVSATDPGLTGYLCMNVELFEGGRFSKKKDPDLFDKEIDKIREKIDPENIRKRKKLISYKKHFDRDGFFVAEFKNQEEVIEGIENRKPFKIHREKDGSCLVKYSPKTNGKGFILISPNRKIMYRLVKNRGFKYDKDGLIIYEYTNKLQARIDKINSKSSKGKKK